MPHAFSNRTRRDLRWRFYPYGKWTCADGREVLFNRFYEPIYDRRPGQPALPIGPTERIAGVIREERYYTDAAKPERAKREKAAAVLIEWGMPIPEDVLGMR